MVLAIDLGKAFFSFPIKTEDQIVLHISVEMTVHINSFAPQPF